MSGSEQASPETKRHVMVFLVASDRALSNALDDLGFTENDDRVIEYDEGRIAFTTCSHERDCDDLFTLIAELASRGETWELVSRIDLDGRMATFHSLARHRAVEAVETELQEEPAAADGDAPSFDLDAAGAAEKLRGAMRRLDASTVYVSVGPGTEGRVVARVVERASRRTLAIATARDEATLRGAIREILPTIMFGLTTKPPR